MHVPSPSSSRPRVYLNFGVSTALPVLLALVPFAYLVRMCVLRTVDLPVADAWGLVPRLDHLYAGTLTLRDLWTQHNEHRLPVPLAVMLAVAWLTDWNTDWEIVVNVAVGVAIFALFCTYLRSAWRDYGGAPRWLVPLLSALLFSPVQWENWLRGWQLAILLGTLMSLLTAYRMAQRDGGGRLVGAIASALCATYCFASGLVVWPAQILGIVAAGRPRRAARLAVWSVAGAITWASYFYDYQRPLQPSMLSNFTSLESLRAFVLYVLVYLGAPIAGYDRWMTIWTGAAGLAAFVAVTFRLRHLRGEPAFLFPVLVGVQTILTALISALGRAWMGLAQPFSSRYTTVSLPLWCGLVCLIVLWRRSSPVGARLAPTLAMASFLPVMIALAFLSTRPAVVFAAANAERYHYLRRGLITGKSEALLIGLGPPNPQFIHDQRAVLKRLHLSVFRRSIQPTYPPPGD